MQWQLPTQGRSKKVRNLGSNTPYNRILLARGLRAFGDGYVSLLLPLYLLELASALSTSV